MFFYHHQSSILVLVLYVDDMLLTGNNLALISSFIITLSTQFAMKDLENLHYFLGVQVVRTSSSMFLSQHKYVFDLLSMFLGPSLSLSLTLTNGELLTDPTEY